ncbi:hypothetical protein FHT36_001737 [Xanthobacter sp. SG618]|uniref:hypothetical protein n=1 Tax=Xanthobacter sp. SG618 TaxID=2587121 RepID=UPI00145CC94C|nr:hypothetical protein [Xanthobacter sp. SG618]NMN57840.1 hypothetical protein [Xanthobacter sp. SG618]
MDRSVIEHHDASLHAGLVGREDTRAVARIEMRPERIRANAEEACRETLARVQAAGRRKRVPAPPDPPFRSGGIRERASGNDPVEAPVRRSRTSG